MIGLAERVWFRACLVLGGLLRAGRYSKIEFVDVNGVRLVRKQRVFYAPLLIGLGGPLMKVLNTGVRVLPKNEWVEREGFLYQHLYGMTVRVNAGAVVLPCLPGQTLAELLERDDLDQSIRAHCITLAVAALFNLHSKGLTHGDAMAENVLVDRSTNTARWFDFETLHDARRDLAWRQSDDLRALLATIVKRTPTTRLSELLPLIFAAYPNERVRRHALSSFRAGFRRSLVFHLGQAALSGDRFREIAECERLPTPPIAAAWGAERVSAHRLSD